MPDEQETETKHAYEEGMEAQLGELRAGIERLKTQADKARAESKIRYYKELEDFRVEVLALETRLAEVRRSKDESWKQLKSGLERSWKELKASWERALARFGIKA